MRRTFVRNGKAPSSGAGGLTLRVAAVSDGTCAGNDDDARARTEGGLHRDFHVAENFHRTRDDGRHNLPNCANDFIAAGSGNAGTCPVHLLGANARRRAGLIDRLLQGFAGSRLANARDVARARGCGCEHSLVVAHDTRSLAPAAINAKKKGHAEVLSQAVYAFGYPAFTNRGLRAKPRLQLLTRATAKEP